MLPDALMIGDHIAERLGVVDDVIPCRFAALTLARPAIECEIRSEPGRIVHLRRHGECETLDEIGRSKSWSGEDHGLGGVFGVTGEDPPSVFIASNVVYHLIPPNVTVKFGDELSSDPSITFRPC